MNGRELMVGGGTLFSKPAQLIEVIMAHTYAISEIIGSSETSVDDAIRCGLATASQTLTNLEWFEVGQIRGHIVDGKVGHFQVNLRLGFRYLPD